MRYYGIQNEVKAYINRLQTENGINVSPSTVKTINDRVESLKDSGVWSRFSLGFNDVEGDANLTRAGVSCAIGAFGSPAGVAPFDGLISAVIRINNTPTTQLNSNVYDLYKSTLGSNLGLP